jgi:hypothetical protein
MIIFCCKLHSWIRNLDSMWKYRLTRQGVRSSARVSAIWGQTPKTEPVHDEYLRTASRIHSKSRKQSADILEIDPQNYLTLDTGFASAECSGIVSLLGLSFPFPILRIHGKSPGSGLKFARLDVFRTAKIRSRRIPCPSHSFPLACFAMFDHVEHSMPWVGIHSTGKREHSQASDHWIWIWFHELNLLMFMFISFHDYVVFIILIHFEPNMIEHVFDWFNHFHGFE